jgi:uncharacterized surface protein with fasciclin (FAS1) repeats
MKKSLIGLGVVSSLLLTSLVPAQVLAGNHGTHGHHAMNMKTKDAFAEYLVMHGYYAEGASLKDRRIGIMKFQKEMSLRETGSLNIQTRAAIRKAMKMPNIVEAAVATPSLSTLVTAVKAGGLVDTLATGGPFTVFAPTNDAFGKIPSATLNALLTPEKKSDLVNILTFHVVSGKALSSDLVDGQEITTLQGGKLKVKITDGKVYINGSQVIIANVKTKNGIVHVIDTVLMP